jgi:hypothetical protein
MVLVELVVLMELVELQDLVVLQVEMVSQALVLILKDKLQQLTIFREAHNKEMLI